MLIRKKKLFKTAQKEQYDSLCKTDCHKNSNLGFFTRQKSRAKIKEI
jgi:hypothetical protein